MGGSCVKETEPRWLKEHSGCRGCFFLYSLISHPFVAGGTGTREKTDVRRPKSINVSLAVFLRNIKLEGPYIEAKLKF